MHHSGVEALVQRDLIASALMFGAVMSGLLSALFVGVWARAQFGGGTALWWQVEAPHSHPHTHPHTRTHTHTPTPTPTLPHPHPFGTAPGIAPWHRRLLLIRASPRSREQAQCAAFVVGYGAVSLTSSVIEAAVCALCIGRAPEPERTPCVLRAA